MKQAPSIVIIHSNSAAIFSRFAFSLLIVHPPQSLSHPFTQIYIMIVSFENNHLYY